METQSGNTALGYATIKNNNSIITLKVKLLRVNNSGSYTVKTLERFESVLRLIPAGRIYTVKEFKTPDNMVLNDYFKKWLV